MAKRKKSTNPSSSAVSRPSRRELRELAARRRRNQNLLLIGAGVVIVALVAFVVALNIRSQAPVGDEASLPSLGNTHIAQGSLSPIEYNSVPPTSGPHYPNLAPWSIFPEPVRYEQLVHNLEDGGVVIYYQCEEACPELVQQLKDVVTPYLNQGRHLVLLPNDPTWTVGDSQPLHQDMDARIALTAWQHIDKFDAFDAERIRSFIEHYEGIDHHQG